MPKTLTQNPLINIVWAPALVLVAHIVVTMTGLYITHWWFDIPMHFIGGMAIACSGYYLIRYFEGTQKFSHSFAPLLILILISFTGLAAASWEMLEFTFDAVFQTALQPGIRDTIKDMAVGVAGGGLAAVAMVIKKK